MSVERSEDQARAQREEGVFRAKRASRTSAARSKFLYERSEKRGCAEQSERKPRAKRGSPTRQSDHPGKAGQPMSPKELAPRVKRGRREDVHVVGRDLVAICGREKRDLNTARDSARPLWKSFMREQIRGTSSPVKHSERGDGFCGSRHRMAESSGIVEIEEDTSYRPWRDILSGSSDGEQRSTGNACVRGRVIGRERR